MDPEPRRRSAIGAAVTVALILAAGQAVAENCLDRVQELAAAYGIETDPPTIPPGEMKKPVTPEDLARSGGVIEPPAARDPSVITPLPSHSGMPTLPDVVPPQEKRQPAAKTSRSLDPAEASTLQALLVAARARAERGMETECVAALRKAREFLQRRHARLE
jgi:hypothetical protein